MAYDPTIYAGCAEHYARGRPAYSRDLLPTLVHALGLDGRGHLLDVGCGPGRLALALHGAFARTTAIDPDHEMLAVAARLASAAGSPGIRWLQARAEDIPALELGPLRLVTFGQSLHWTDREQVARDLHERVEPGGAIALISHAHAGRPRPAGPGWPIIPHDAIKAVIDRYLGPVRRAGQGEPPRIDERHEVVLARAGFARIDVLYCAGRDDIVQDIDAVVSNFLSMSFAAPHLFGPALPDFVADVRALLARESSRGLFWDWPGDTEIVVARR